MAGALGFLLVGNTPATLDGETLADTGWTLSPPAAPDVAAAQAVMSAQPVWVSQPAAVSASDAAPPPPSPPRLLGIIRVGLAANRGTAQAVFLLPDGRRERAAAGARLADGTAVERLGDTDATIRMADGRTFELRLLGGPASPASP